MDKLSIVIFGIKVLFLLAVFPLFLLYRVSRLGRWGIKSLLVRLVFIVAIFLTFLPLWIGGYLIVGTTIVYRLGYIPEDLTIVGTGSMYPTWPKGTKGKTPKELAEEVVGNTGFLKYPNGLVLFGSRILGHQIGREDIVVVEDDKTRKLTQERYGSPSGWLKRAIAVGGDTLEIKDGIVYLNSQPLKEPYIAKARSTFGESFLKECNKITVPENSIFVMGDNRKGSGDSREVGFFSLGDVKYVLPLKSQKGDLMKYWRDTSKDLDESSKIRLDKEKYIQLLNEKRKEAGARPLKYQPKLALSADKRGEVILKYDDFSYEATRSGYTMKKAMQEARYSNIVWDEAFVQGYYEAEELIEYYFEFPEWKKFLLEKDYQEIGISEVEGKINNCPTQVIVQHLAGYVPPNYKKEDIESWRSVVSNLDSIIPSWEKIRGWDNINQEDLKRLLNLLDRERTIASNILAQMDANKWLTKQEEDTIKEYESIAKESSGLANKLNGR